MASVDQTLLQAVLVVAKTAAREAGALISEHTGRTDVDKTKLTQQDLVTKVDKACQDLIEKHIMEAFPDHQILGEESVLPGSDASTAALELVRSAEWLW